ncbi:hypothetical protein FZEAL_789 [Fusarium zealandicum]|uniref:NADP-dependent oxidoreductase domain-containing protein n=1 Tax=Fusarium zealandicum TaxID=1053134 RepID=A0A8H4UU25_9HYPO|nr:hypothetical protein FZEAL_789 [Fusarium zealandicum]
MAWSEPRNTGMIYRRLGRSGLHVSILGLGSWMTYGEYAQDQAFDCMKKAYDLGINFFDTAENYTAGESEIVMGKAIKHFGWKRSDLVISTKINWGAVNGEVLVNNHGLSRKHIVEGLEASLARLQLRYVDVVYAHRPDRLTPMEETVRAFNYVIDNGLAFYWGTSEWSADEIAEAVGIARDLRMIPPIVEQPQYNMLVRDKVEGQFQRLYERNGLGLTTFSPIKMGLLSGKYNDLVDGQPPKDSRFGASKDGFADFMRDRMGSDDWKEEIEQVRQLKPIADKLGVSQSQLAIAWCLKNPNVSSVITGASRPEQLEENVGALKVLDKLTPEILGEIDAITKNKVTLDPARQRRVIIGDIRVPTDLGLETDDNEALSIAQLDHLRPELRVDEEDFIIISETIESLVLEIQTMSQKYAKDQPEGFNNHIEKVAIVGAGGSVGQYLAKALAETGKHQVTAITRVGSTSKIPSGINTVSVDYEDEDSVVAALKGQQFLAISMSVTAAPGTQEKIIKAAAKAGVPWIMPNCFGIDITNASLAKENLTGQSVMPGIKAIEETGVSSWVAMCCSYWYEFSVAQGPQWYGFDFSNNQKKITFYDDGMTQINTSTWLQCGRALVSLLNLKELPEDENDKSPTISQWRNKPLYISSFLLSQREMLDSVQRVTGTTDKDWQIEHEGSKARWQRGMDLLSSGDRSGWALAMYARTFYPNGDGNFEAKHGLANDVLGLPKEDLDEASKRAIGMVEASYNYYGNRID